MVDNNNNRALWITCPRCSHRAQHAVPSLFHLVAQECDNCGSLFETPHGMHCVFCAYGDEDCGTGGSR